MKVMTPSLFHSYLVKTRGKTVFAQVKLPQRQCLDPHPPSKPQTVSRYKVVRKMFQGTARGLHINIEPYPPTPIVHFHPVLGIAKSKHSHFHHASLHCPVDPVLDAALSGLGGSTGTPCPAAESSRCIAMPPIMLMPIPIPGSGSCGGGPWPSLSSA